MAAGIFGSSVVFSHLFSVNDLTDFLITTTLRENKPRHGTSCKRNTIIFTKIILKLEPIAHCSMPSAHKNVRCKM